METTATALVRLLVAQGQEIDGCVAAAHRAVADRVFRALGPLGRPTRAIHDLVADGVHGAIRAALGGIGWVGAHAVAQVSDEVVLASTRGRALIGAVLGLIGDTVREVEPHLAWPTVLLHEGEVVAAHGGDATEPTSCDEVVVLLHGLCETELAWRIGTGPERPTLPSVLRRDGREVLLARMNTGIRPGELGRELAELLEQRAGTARVVLVGHSLGGLVARAALRWGTAQGQAWVRRCDALVTLGTPHLGAPLERAVDLLVRVGGRTPEVDAVTRWFDQRSVGIRDLAHGSDHDGEGPGVAIAAAPIPDHVRLHTVGASLPGVRGVLFGDGLVRPVSAHGHGLRRSLQARRGQPLDIVGSHFDLLCEPAVTSHVAALVDPSPALQRA